MRPSWSGAISFGLIHIPVKLYTAVKESTLDLDMLRKGDLCPIRYVRVCRATGEEVPYEDIVKGYEYRKGDYVILQDEDFERANVKKTQTIEILNFTDQSGIDPKYLEKPYYVEPAKEAKKAYALLREALKKSGRVGVARYVLKTREHLGILKPEGDVIILDQMRFDREVIKPEGLNLPEEEVSKKELDMAIKLIDQLAEPFRPEEYRDTYIEELKQLIEEKAKGKLRKVRKEKAPEPGVVDIMAKLRESLDQARKKEAGERKRPHLKVVGGKK